MVVTLPFLYLPAAGLLSVLAAWRNRVLHGLAGALVLASFLVQWLPILVNFNTYIQLRDEYERLFVPAASPLVGHARLWLERADEWRLRIAPPDGVVVLREGFSYSEGDRTQGDVLPRWTYADARMHVYPFSTDGPLYGRLVVGDHRPWPLERAQFGLLLNGEPLTDVQRVDLTGEQIVWELRFRLAPEQVARAAVLNLHSDTWNPTRATEENPRNEELGLLLQSVELSQLGRPLELRESLPIPRPTSDRRGLWLWYYDTPNHHLFDVWLWYVWVADLPAGTVVLLVGVIGLPALAAFAVGLRGVLHSMRSDQYCL
jgi:hypothetical protein